MRLHRPLPSNAAAGLQGVDIKGQLGFFAEWMPGANPEKWSKDLKRQWVNRIPIEWVRHLPQHAWAVAGPTMCSDAQNMQGKPSNSHHDVAACSRVSASALWHGTGYCPVHACPFALHPLLDSAHQHLQVPFWAEPGVVIPGHACRSG